MVIMLVMMVTMLVKTENMMAKMVMSSFHRHNKWAGQRPDLEKIKQSRSSLCQKYISLKTASSRQMKFLPSSAFIIISKVELHLAGCSS